MTIRWSIKLNIVIPFVNYSSLFKFSLLFILVTLTWFFFHSLFLGLEAHSDIRIVCIGCFGQNELEESSCALLLLFS